MSGWKGNTENQVLGWDATRKHGMYGSAEYQTWSHMKQRCLNVNNDRYEDYGGRGITVCARWLDFMAFYEDMGPRPPGMTLNRIDNERGYEPGNCAWATRKQQQNNMRRNVSYRIKGQRMTAAEINEQYGVSQTTFLTRLGRGWTVEQAATIPVSGKRGRRGAVRPSKTAISQTHELTYEPD